MYRFTVGTGLSAMIVLAACTVGGATDDGARSGDSKNVTWYEPIEVVTGNATRGPWRMNRSEWDFVDDPTVAINAQDFIGVAWADHTRQDILFRLYRPDGAPVHDEPTTVLGSSNIFSWLPRMILTDGNDPNDLTVYLLWQEIVFSGGSHGGEIFFARSRDGGNTFSDPVNLSNTTAGAGKGRLTPQNWHNGSYDLAISADGDLYAAWTEYEGNLWFSRSTDGGESFSEPLHIAGGQGTSPARGPSLAVGPDGAIVLAWTIGEDDAANIHISRSTDGGESFTSPRIVHEGAGHADAPKMAADSRGRVHLVYADAEGGMFDRYRIVYASARGDELEFATPQTIVAAGDLQAASVNFPHFQVDGSDNLYLSWEIFPNHRGRPVGIGFARSTDGGDSFTSPITIPGSGERAQGFSGSQQGLLMSKLAVNERGRIAVVNSTYLPNQESRVVLIRGAISEDAGTDDRPGDDR